MKSNSMATIIIVGWKEDSIDYSGWGEHIYVELNRRLRASLDISPRIAKSIAKDVTAKKCFKICRIKKNDIEGVSQLLDIMGVEMTIERDA